MKQKDYALIGVVIFISIIVSYEVSNNLFSVAKKGVKVDSVPAIQSNLELPSNQFFNPNSIDPSQPISIGQSNNSNSFTQNSNNN